MTLAESSAGTVALPYDTLGKTLALLNAVVWAIALVYFKKSGDRVPPLALNLFKNAVGLTLLGITLLALPLFVPHWSPAIPWRVLDPQRSELWILLVSGVLGIAVADTIFFFALNRAGVGLIAIVDCLYTPFVMLFAWLLLC